MMQLPLGIALREAATFENYFTTDNDQALNAIRTALSVGESAVIYLWGGGEVGKSHLLQAACHLAAESGMSSTYLPLGEAESWPPEMIEGFESLELVCLDDVGQVAGRADWEEALFHLFNRLQEAGGILLVSADVAPASLSVKLNDLKSRLAWGLTFQLQPLDDEQKQQALKTLAQRRGLELPDESATYLLRHAPRGQGLLFSLLDRLDEASMIEQRRLTIPFIKSVLNP
ncbi:DnaA regulatory inactivator Hda [Solemya pervernicosa gill symbiont]|uniref:DnaA regulatory inactivator Hda n=2 Tax=Gammaproteobacteria incertae sedis TaxID=118884 RepID=A0A1T2L8H7_9GAMM|nr:DnaA regulatory inactivator Hda [Candidatus Reidiella endopervernicosa]OOZ41391.1 DnaA regulatory inactivator Hda [Solemya pervernicosa gill symbiont]QKQ27570.1 DnaA regulatory inactivator Hda [Candidatus Reidiella endopervernicosa]